MPGMKLIKTYERSERWEVPNSDLRVAIYIRFAFSSLTPLWVPDNKENVHPGMDGRVLERMRNEWLEKHLTWERI